ncbi:MAG: RNA-guided endonuclease InsQ/TnpB family protein [Blastocatellia bacterium]
MRTAFKYRLYPTKKQAEFLDGQLAEACRLYNAALQERRDAYSINRVSINYYDQAHQLKEIRAEGDSGLENFSCSQDVLRRVDKTFKAFFRRCKEGTGKAGFPRFKPRDRYNSISFPSYGDGCRLMPNGKLRIQGAGFIKVKLHRAVEGKIKTVTILREVDNYYACFSCEVEAQPLPPLESVIGIDVGLTTFAVLSDGTEIDNPRFFKASEEKLANAQKVLARKKRGSNSRKKAKKTVQKLHAKIRNQRNDFQHKVSRRIVNNYGSIYVEKLNIRGLAGGMLAKSVQDAAWRGFLDKTSYKASNAGRVYGEVYAPGSSQECLCGAEVRKKLSDRWHHCVSCGLSEPRDHVSSKIIKARGLRASRKNLPNEAALL